MLVVLSIIRLCSLHGIRDCLLKKRHSETRNLANVLTARIIGTAVFLPSRCLLASYRVSRFFIDHVLPLKGVFVD